MNGTAGLPQCRGRACEAMHALGYVCTEILQTLAALVLLHRAQCALSRLASTRRPGSAAACALQLRRPLEICNAQAAESKVPALHTVRSRRA